MAQTVYVTSLEPASGKSLVSLGALETAAAASSHVGYFRPVIAAGPDADRMIELFRGRFDLAQSYEASFGATTDDTRGLGESIDAALLHRILSKYEALAEQCSVVIVEGTDFSGASAAFEFALNAEIAAHMGAPVVMVARAQEHRPEHIIGVVHAALNSLRERRLTVLGLVVNRVPPDQLGRYRSLLQPIAGVSVWVLPDEPGISRPTLADLAALPGTELLSGSPESLTREVRHVVVGAMTLPHLLDHLVTDTLLVLPGDRADVVLMSQAARFSSEVPAISGLLLTGGYRPEDSVMRFISGMGESTVPMLTTAAGTYETVDRVAHTHGTLESGDERRIELALRTFEDHVEVATLAGLVADARTDTVTPLMFERRLIARARSEKRHIVLPEGSEDRVLQAADRLLRRDVADLTILGGIGEVTRRADLLGLDLSGARLVDPVTDDLRRQYADAILTARAAKGMTAEVAWDLARDVSWFGTLMVASGAADGMVSGAAHTTADTVRPALQMIRTAPGTSVVSSVFLMALQDRVLVYGDCAVVPDPDAVQLADIALSSARTARAFGIDPYVALLSYSTGASGSGADVEKVATATAIVRRQAPDLPVEGPIQYDAAVDPSVAAAKLPGSQVAGRATVLVFPDLNTGNNTYKAVQRSAGAVAIGPILQGLRLPVNDLSRGATIDDIVNTVVITAIQAQRPRDDAAK